MVGVVIGLSLKKSQGIQEALEVTLAPEEDRLTVLL